MSDILSRLEAQGQDFSNIAQRGQEMVQGFDNDRLMAQGQTLAYNMGKAQLSTLIGAETVAGLQHGVPVAYKTGKAIAQRLSGMPTTREEAVARAQAAAQKAGEQVAQRVKSTAEPLTENITQETSSGAPGDFLQYDVQRGTVVTSTGEEVGNNYFDTELQTPSGARADPVLQQERLERLENPPDPAPDQFITVGNRLEYPDFGPRSFKAPTESEFRAETERQRIAARASSGPPAPPEPAQPASFDPTAPVEGEVPAPARPQQYPASRGPAQAPRAPRAPRDQLPDPVEFTEGQTITAPELSSAADTSGTVSKGIGIVSQDTGGPEAPILRSVDDLFPAPPPTTTQLPTPAQLPTPTPAVPVDAQGRELQPQQQQQNSPEAQALKQQDDEYAELQERLDNLRVQDGDGSGQPSQQPEFKEDEPDKPSGSGVLDDITKAEADVAPEEEIADAVPGLGEILGGVIGLGALIGGAIEGAEAPKAPQQPAGMPSMQTAYDSAPVIDSSDYHSL